MAMRKRTPMLTYGGCRALRHLRHRWNAVGGYLSMDGRQLTYYRCRRCGAERTDNQEAPAWR